MLQNAQYSIQNCFRKKYANERGVLTILKFRNILKKQYRSGVFSSILLMLLPMYGECAGEFEEIAPGIYLRAGMHEDFSKTNQGHIANIGFIVGRDRVAVIDTGSSLQEGLALRREIREVTDLPIEFVILTHMHPDHSLGAAAFTQDKPKFIGHSLLGDALARRQAVYLENMQRILGSTAEGTEVVFPNQSVAEDQQLILNLGGRLLHLTAYPTAHTNNDLTIFDSKTGTFWLSDLLFVDRVPVIDGSLLGWLRVIDQLLERNCFHNEPFVVKQKIKQKEKLGPSCQAIARVVPGHGPVVTEWKSALRKQQRYFNLIANEIRLIIKNRGTITQAVEQVGIVEYPNWLLFKKYHGRNVTAAFAELEWE